MKDTNEKDLIHEIWEVELKDDRFARYSGIDIISIEPGKCVAEMPLEDHHLNPFNTVHGGCLYTLADTVGGVTASSIGAAGPTISGDMHFFRTSFGSKKLRAVGEVIKRGHAINVLEVRIYNEKEVLLAKSSLEYMRVDVEKYKESGLKK